MTGHQLAKADLTAILEFLSDIPAQLGPVHHNVGAEGRCIRSHPLSFSGQSLR
jgi:UDP-N-acetylenolpyruvoylglucosamine reductase